MDVLVVQFSRKINIWTNLKNDFGLTFAKSLNLVPEILGCF